MATCKAPGCKNELTGRQRHWCSDTCKMRGHRAKPGDSSGKTNRNNRNVTIEDGSKLDKLAEQIDRVSARLEELAEKIDEHKRTPEHYPTDALIGPVNRSADLQHEMRDLLREIKAELTGRAVHRTVSAPVANDDDLLDTLEVKQASSSGVDAAANLVNSMLALQSKKPKEEQD